MLKPKRPRSHPTGIFGSNSACFSVYNIGNRTTRVNRTPGEQPLRTKFPAFAHRVATGTMSGMGRGDVLATTAGDRPEQIACGFQRTIFGSAHAKKKWTGGPMNRICPYSVYAPILSGSGDINFPMDWHTVNTGPQVVRRPKGYQSPGSIAQGFIADL